MKLFFDFVHLGGMMSSPLVIALAACLDAAGGLTAILFIPF